jgi:hypothetical protein
VKPQTPLRTSCSNSGQLLLRLHYVPYAATQDTSYSDSITYLTQQLRTPLTQTPLRTLCMQQLRTPLSYSDSICSNPGHLLQCSPLCTSCSNQLGHLLLRLHYIPYAATQDTSYSDSITYLMQQPRTCTSYTEASDSLTYMYLMQ